MTDVLVNRLVRIPAAVVAAALVVGALLADVHTFVITPAIDGAEPAQWTARVGIMLYYLVLPLALLAVWARRRDSLGRVGRVAAVLIAIQVLCYVLLTAAMLVWGLVLGRGDLSDTAMWLESLGVLSFYLGLVVLAVRLLLGSRANAALGVLILIGFLASFAGPFLLTAAFVVLAAVFLVQEVGSRDEVVTAAAH